MKRAIFGLTLLATVFGSAALAPAEARWAWNGYRYVWVHDCGPRCEAWRRWHYWHGGYPPAPPPPPGYYR